MSPPPRIRLALLALAAACAPGCKVAGAKAYNLRILHDDRGRHVRLAKTMSDFRYSLNEELAGTSISVGGVSPDDNKIKNPLGECVDILNALGKMDPVDPRVSAVQVEIYAWLGVDDPWQISRTVCVRELAEIGPRLDITILPPDDAPTAGVDEVRNALARMLRAVRIERGQEAGVEQSDLAAACAHVDSLKLERQGALRLLRALAVIEKATSRRDPRWEPLRATILGLQRICVREALLSALGDRPPREVSGSHPGWNSPWVRAEAVTACVRTFGPGALGEMLLQLQAEPEPLVLGAVLREVSEHGLPEGLPGVPAAGMEELRLRWTALIVQQATQNRNGAVRVAAMRALETISGGELRSLREEDWLAWHQARAGSGPESEVPAGPSAAAEAAPPPPPPPADDAPPPPPSEERPW